jgi:hypothetical protein
MHQRRAVVVQQASMRRSTLCSRMAALIQYGLLLDMRLSQPILRTAWTAPLVYMTQEMLAYWRQTSPVHHAHRALIQEPPLQAQRTVQIRAPTALPA